MGIYDDKKDKNTINNHLPKTKANVPMPEVKPCKTSLDDEILRILDKHNNDPITLTGEIDKESLDKLKKSCEIPEDIKIKIVEIYNYMAKTGTGKIVFQFETGIKMICEIDDSEWKNKPKIDLSEVLKNDK